MKVDGAIGSICGRRAEHAQEAEAAGYSGLWTAETGHDPFLPLLAGRRAHGASRARHVHRRRVRPQPHAPRQHGWDLQAYSGGRFILGLGSQIKPHITKRFSMPWSHPAPRMREMVLAIRAIWDCWLNGTKLEFRGDFYTHTLMTPFFAPDPGTWPRSACPKVFLAGVGELMTEVAGEVCDGFICHGFTTERYLREVTLPALARGGPRPARPWRASRSSGPSFVVTGGDEARAGRGRHRHPPADRLLRLDARPTGRCSTSTAGAGCRTS